MTAKIASPTLAPPRLVALEERRSSSPTPSVVVSARLACGSSRGAPVASFSHAGRTRRRKRSVRRGIDASCAT